MKKIINIFLLLFVISCKQVSYDDNVAKINIPLNENERIINLSEIIESLEYIPLETKEECLIGYIHRIIPLDSVFVLVDTRITSSVFIFDKSGNFINKIARKGRGPGEYFDLTDACYDPVGKRIIILDGYSSKLLFYSMKGDFLEEKELGGAIFRAVSFVSENYIALYCDYAISSKFESDLSYPNLVIYDMQNDIVIERDLYFDSGINTKGIIMSLINNFSTYRDSPAVGLIVPLNDTIYSITKEGVKRNYFVNFGKSKEKAMKRINRLAMDQSRIAGDAGKESRQAKYPILMDYIESRDVIFLQYKKEEMYYYGFYYPDKNIFKESSGRYDSAPYSTMPIKNDIDGKVYFSPQTSDGESFYYYVDAHKLDGVQNGDNKMANPVIVKALIKK